MAHDIFKRARAPLHVSEIIDRIQTQCGVTVDRESLVSSLSKKVARQDRFLRLEKNTSRFGPKPDEANWLRFSRLSKLICERRGGTPTAR